MGSMRRRLERLETSGKAPAPENTVYLDVYFKALENIRRKEAGFEPLPFTEEEEEYQREPDRWFRDEYLPSQREKPDLSEHARAILEQLEAHTSERKLT